MEIIHVLVLIGFLFYNRLNFIYIRIRKGDRCSEEENSLNSPNYYVIK